ncbi:hypothetical protein GOBAR_AA40050 [Gossypium barbadense]|uniref:Uncharacterized protein n=1 Tax=Gossypium barbadense TaxID=3634 RepID=A0A2P5VPA9_GOSBA|nr:hypothetical protein GOBAR_AA40050 [Gossypium barbadense]
MSCFNTTVSHGRVTSPDWPRLQARPCAWPSTPLTVSNSVARLRVRVPHATCGTGSSSFTSSQPLFIALSCCNSGSGAMNPSLSWALIALRCSLGLSSVLLVFWKWVSDTEMNFESISSRFCFFSC